MKSAANSLPPAILLGGSCNALSVARSLGRASVPVYALNSPDAHVRYSRYCTLLRPRGGDDLAGWTEFLLGSESEPFRGAVLLACSDAEVELLVKHRAQLANKFLLDLADENQLRVMNKLNTYRIGQAAGVPLPRFWTPQNREQMEGLREELPFPLLVKPLFAHVYRKKFTRRLVIARDFEEALKGFRTAQAAGVEVMLVEMIPGPDDRLCSYYTYLDEQGTPQFHFTKRIIRRYPEVLGGGCYHVTDWIPEVRDLSLQFLRAAGMRGLANLEFKRDERDGRLKLIECNVRFTEANCLVADSGLNLALFVYNRLVGRPLPPLTDYRKGLRLWYPVEDFYAFRELKRQGRLTFGRWLAEVAHRQTFPYFRWDDPLPSLVREAARLRSALGRRWGRLKGWLLPGMPAGVQEARP